MKELWIINNDNSNSNSNCNSSEFQWLPGGRSVGKKSELFFKCMFLKKFWFTRCQNQKNVKFNCRNIKVERRANT